MTNEAGKTFCFFNSAKTWGGGEKWHHETASFLQEEGYRVIVITNPDSALSHKLPNNIQQISCRVGNLSFLNPFKVFRLKKILHAHHVDTIVINLSADLKLAGLAAKLAGVRRIIYRRGSAIPIKNNLLNRFYFSNILTDVLANSEATKKTILQNNATLFPAHKIEVIYNPLHTDEFISRAFQPIYQKRNDELVLASVGRLAPEKNHLFLIRLATELKSKHIIFKLLIGGTGPLEKELKRHAEEQDVYEDIIFTGFVNNVKDILYSCDIFILPSLWEGFGYVIAEASLCKRAVIAFNIASLPELVVDNKTGFLCPLNDVACVMDKIKILKQQPALLHEFGESGRAFVQAKFADDKIEKQLLAYFSR